MRVGADASGAVKVQPGDPVERRAPSRLARCVRAAVRPPPAFVLVAAPAVGVAIALWMTHGVWGGRAPAGDDTLAHVIRAQFASRYLFSHGRLDGWDPSFILGY